MVDSERKQQKTLSTVHYPLSTSYRFIYFDYGGTLAQCPDGDLGVAVATVLDRAGAAIDRESAMAAAFEAFKEAGGAAGQRGDPEAARRGPGASSTARQLGIGNSARGESRDKPPAVAHRPGGPDGPGEHSVERADLFFARWGALALKRLGDRAGPYAATTDDPVMRFVTDVRQETWDHRIVFDDTVPTLRALSGAGFRLGVLSNNDGSCPQKLEAGGLDGFFEVAIDSAEVRAAKPDPRIFESAAKAAGVAPGEILHVGDSYNSDVIGGSRAGFATCWLNRKGESRPTDDAGPTFEVRTLLEIPSLLGVSPRR